MKRHLWKVEYEKDCGMAFDRETKYFVTNSFDITTIPIKTKDNCTSGIPVKRIDYLGEVEAS